MPLPIAGAIIGSAAIGALGNLFNGWAQGKVSEKQLKMQAEALGLSREQFEFQKKQALRQNQIQDRNVAKINPLMDMMIQRQGRIMSQPPQYTRLAPPSINNPYGGKAPPVVSMPGMDYSQLDPRMMAARAAGVR